MIDPVTRWIISACAGLALLCLVFIWGGHGARHDLKAAREAHATVLSNLATLTKAAEDKARAASEAVRLEREAVDKRLKDVQDEAKRENNRLRADLAAGKRRLQARWTCPATGPAEGGTSTDAGEADSASRNDGAAAIIGAADTDAAVIDWLWDSWSADRKAVIDAGCAVVSQNEE